MWNRIVAFFILIFIFLTWYLVYYFYFILNKGSIKITSNVDNYEITLFNKKLKTSFTKDCLTQICEVKDLWRFNYEISIFKKWYKNQKIDIEITSKDLISLNIILQKQLNIQKQETLKEIKEDNNQKIDKLRELNQLKKKYSFFDLKDLWYFYFEEIDEDTISLFQNIDSNTTKLYSFWKIEKNLIDILKVDQVENIIFITYWEEKYIYDLNLFKIDKVFFPQKVDYVKKYSNIYSFVNDKWTFLYDNISKKIEFFYLFKDFVYYDKDNYLWVIFKNELQKKKNYNLDKDANNLIVKYNFKNKDLKILEDVDINIAKIVIEDKDIYFYDKNNQKYLVNNIE